MNWMNQQHKKNKLYNLVEQAMKDPRYQEAQKKQIEDATSQAFTSFLLMSVDYLYRHHDYGKEELLEYVDFVVEQMKAVQTDAEYFKLLNEALLDETGVDILNNLVK